jgi:CheY-like chemotaxis protein
MAVVLLTSDLTVVSRVEGVAARVGADVRTFSSASQAFSCCVAEHADRLILDLSFPSLDVQSLVDQLKSAAPNPPRVIAFGPHVHEGRLAAAREAGCDEVVSRGEFFARMPAMLGG